jgi:putative transposase
VLNRGNVFHKDSDYATSRKLVGEGHGSGHLWQGRFRAFPIAEDEHLLRVLRYVERNPLRAGLVKRAGDWPWSSAVARVGQPLLDPGPVPRPTDWLARVDEPQTEAEMKGVRRGRPYGNASRMVEAARRLGLEASLRPRGRPRKTATGDGLPMSEP